MSDDRKFLGDKSAGGRVPCSYPYSHTAKPPRTHTAQGNRDISPMGSGNLNRRVAAMDPADRGKGELDTGLAFRIPMDEEYDDYIIQDD